MRVTPIDIHGVLLLEPSVSSDHRGCFLETYHEQRYRDAGITEQFVQDNCSRSVRNTLRGLHFQEPHGQGKLVMALEGTVYDVVVDIRTGSPTFGKWYGVELSGKNLHQLYIPPGCAHGFCVTSETATFLYKCTAYYSPRDERGILWNDPALGIRWPISEPLLSPKDQAYRTIKEMDSELPVYKPTP
ncbi:MAG: dTDP-4-dehydrorhamnose 3,5-epimerase [Nitrospira sp.]|nr:MAG: dTDP-4-dehydrorhamnose 3,5-epimerase [Nitrospira sp.]